MYYNRKVQNKRSNEMKILLMALVVAGMVGTVIPTHGKNAQPIYLGSTAADREGEGVVMKNEKKTQVTKDRAKEKARGKQIDKSML